MNFVHGGDKHKKGTILRFDSDNKNGEKLTRRSSPWGFLPIQSQTYTEEFSTHYPTVMSGLYYGEDRGAVTNDLRRNYLCPLTMSLSPRVHSHGMYICTVCTHVNLLFKMKKYRSSRTKCHRSELVMTSFHGRASKIILVRGGHLSTNRKVAATRASEGRCLATGSNEV